MGLWRDIVLEGFCTYNWASKKNWKTFKYIGKGKISDKAITKKNDEYIPKSKRPTWCKKNNPKRLPQYSCLAGRKSEDKCPFFTYCNATKALYGWISFYYEKKSNR